MTSVFGILNVTRDSFSDGGIWLEPWAAIARGRELRNAGADVVDIGAESTHPEAETVPAPVEIARLEPVVRALQAAGIQVSVDTSKPEVMRAMSQLGVAFLNDVSGFRTEASVDAAAQSQAKLVVMFARNAGPRAERRQDLRRVRLEQVVDRRHGRRLGLEPGGVVPVHDADLQAFPWTDWHGEPRVNLDARTAGTIVDDPAGTPVRACLSASLDEFEAAARVRLFGDLGEHFRTIAAFPAEATEGVTDEQFLRNVVDVLYRARPAMDSFAG